MGGAGGSAGGWVGRIRVGLADPQGSEGVGLQGERGCSIGRECQGQGAEKRGSWCSLGARANCLGFPSPKSALQTHRSLLKIGLTLYSIYIAHLLR